MYWFDQAKLEVISKKRSIEEWFRIMYNADYTLTIYQTSNPPTFRTAKEALQRRLNAADLKLISSVIAKSNKSAFQSLSDLEFVGLYQQFALQACDFANEENKRFYTTNEKYILGYQEMLRSRLGLYGITSTSNTLDFPKTLKDIGIGIFSVTLLTNELYSTGSSTYHHDFRHGKMYHLLSQTVTPKMHQQSLSNLAKHHEKLQQQAQFFESVFLHSYLHVINLMIQDGFSLEEAKRVFPNA